MTELNQELENHYLTTGLYEDIISRLLEMNVDIDNVKRSDIAGVDEFHVRGAAVSKELAQSINLNGLNILDVGCALGGPCRMLADEYNCNVTGLDLSNEFIRTAKKLSKLVRLEDKTSFVVGDAAELPFENDSFDAVWTQHVQMNVPDKTKFYSEIARVTKPNGHFLYYDILKGNDVPVTYPMPWASNTEQSFLFKSSEMHAILSDQGFTRVELVDQTAKGIDFFQSLLEKIKLNGPPKLGLNVLMGESTKPKLINLLEHLKSNAVVLESGVFTKS